MIEVAIAIIKNPSGDFLITRRAHNVPHGGLWEVPGGKIEADETPAAALSREIYEEVGLSVLASELIGKTTHTYPDKTVCFHIFHVKTYQGDAKCCDGQLDLRWVSRESLKQFEFPEANQAILAMI